MAKNSSSNKVTIIAGLVIILIIALAVIMWKYHQAKERWGNYAMQMQYVTMQRPMDNSQEAAMVIGSTIALTPSTSPLYKQPKQLEEYISAMSQQLNRDVVVVDKNKVILADTIASNIGKKYMEDTHGEVASTIGDSKTRMFLEKSTDYPSGIDQTVVPFKDQTGGMLGAVILSSTPIK